MAKAAQITITGVDGSVWVISGKGAGAQGVELSTDPKGIYDAPVTTIWNSTAFQTGATYGGLRVNKRDIVFAVWIWQMPGQSWESIDAAWRRAWAYDADCTMTITTETGSRSLQLRLSEQMDFDPPHDPHIKAQAMVTLTCTAGVPWWVETDITETWVSPTNTTAGTSVAHGSVTIENPTDQPMYLQWVVSAPGQWTLPDFSFGLDYLNGFGTGANNVDRVIILPTQAAGQILTIDTDPSQEMIVSSDGSNFWALMNGISFLYPVPPWTPATSLPVAVTLAPAGAILTVIQPRNFSRPWGLR